jgi:hypothetical protein
MEIQPETKSTEKQKPLAWALLALTVLIIVRLLPLLKAPLAFFGYDYGFYLYAANHASSLQLGTALWGGYNSPLFYLAHLLHVPPALVLNEFYLLATVCLGLCWYIFYRPNWQAGVWAALFTAFSLFQIEAYTMYLWKNIIALPFLLLGFKFLSEKKYWPWILCSFMILLTHRTTAIFYLLTVGIYLLCLQLRAKRYFWILGATAAGIVIVFAFWSKLYPIYINLIYNNNEYVRTGLFLEGQNLFALLWPILLLALPGLYLYWKRKQNSLLIIFTAVCALWIIFKLPFFHRVWIYVDLSLVGFAAYFLGQINYASKWLKIAAIIVIVFLGYRAIDYTLNKEPSIYPEEVAEIQNFNRTGFVLAVSANDAPWLLGYAKNVRLGAPGLFEDPHTYQQWLDFWAGKNQNEFLANYPRPLYFYQRSYRMQGQINSCLSPLSQNFSQYICQ